jgi:Hint domain-containing protein
MERPDDVSSRRQLFRAALAGAVTLPFVALASRSADAQATTNTATTAARRKVSCLLKGTRVSMPAGERLVEDLKIGDEVVTLSGPKAIRWIGYTKYTKDADRPWLARVMPIRVARSAIADQAPHRDLYLSPEHRVFVNDVLIAVKHLVNGTSIAPAAPADMAMIEYYHIEFDAHEVMLAEGAPVESFMEVNSEREYFSNFVQYERLYGCDQARMTPFAPILGYRNRRQKLAGLARSVVSSIVDVRDPIQVARDQFARRAETLRLTC